LARHLPKGERRRAELARQGEKTHHGSGPVRPHHQPTPERSFMKWTKPEAEVVAVTMEVTAYVATL
jgi:hypothetical protein